MILGVGDAVPTINYRVDYLRPATGHEIRARAMVRRAGRTVGSRFQYLPELRCVVFQEGHNYGGALNGDGKRPGRLLMIFPVPVIVPR